MLATGALLIATTQALPQLLQDQYRLHGHAGRSGDFTGRCGHHDHDGRGWASAAWSFSAAALSDQHRRSDCGLRNGRFVSNDAGRGFLVLRVVADLSRRIGLPLIFIPITTASYDGIPPSKTDQASALINLARNFGGSMGVSLSQTVLARREQFHQGRLVEHVGSWNPFYADTLNRVEAYFRAHTSTGSAAGASTRFHWSTGPNPGDDPGLHRCVRRACRRRGGDGAAGAVIARRQAKRQAGGGAHSA